MKRMREDGWEVHAVCPLDKYKEDLEKDGIIVHDIRLSRHGKNPFRDIRYLIRLYRIVQLIRPSIVHSFTIKPNIYGNLAAALAGVPKRINTISGLGYVYIGSNIRKKILRFIVNLLYKIAFIFSHKVIFQNDDDCELFTEHYRIIPKGKTIVIKSSGVDCDYFSKDTVDGGRVAYLQKEFMIPNDAIVVSMIARMIWEKGIREFVEAAKLVRKEYPDVIFLLVGSLENGSPSAVPESYLHEESSTVKWLGHQRDIKHIIALSSVIALPSYREGVPKVLLEAMAMSKPIITTNSVGCREVVKNEKNGYVVNIKDEMGLKQSIMLLIQNRHTMALFGENGRIAVEGEWRDTSIIRKQIALYGA